MDSTELQDSSWMANGCWRRFSPVLFSIFVQNRLKERFEDRRFREGSHTTGSRRESYGLPSGGDSRKKRVKVAGAAPPVGSKFPIEAEFVFSDLFFDLPCPRNEQESYCAHILHL